MDLGLKDKVALVAAASKGIGKATALALSGEGAKVAVCSRTPEALAATADEIRRLTGNEVWAHPCDVSVPAETERWARAALEHFGSVDVLVNNAGGPPAGEFLDFGIKDWENACRLNLLSAVTLCSVVLPVMKSREWGRIINLTSVAVKQPIDGLILSNAIRCGVIGLAKSLSREYAPYNITVNNVCPGYTRTERVEKLAASTAQREATDEGSVYRRWESEIPAGRLGRPEEIADMVCFLASVRAGYVNGATIQVDGGYVKSTM